MIYESKLYFPFLPLVEEVSTVIVQSSFRKYQLRHGNLVLRNSLCVCSSSIGWHPHTVHDGNF